MTKQFFPGANTGRGFVNRFSGIVPPWAEPHYTYVLKGGPGVGKNTLMRRAAERAVKAGYTVEEFRCASDPDSFDAVRIPQIRTVILDGTAPHIVDPVLPGIADEVIDLGYFKAQAAFSEYRQTLDRLFSDNAAHYRAAYACLGAAYTLKRHMLNALRENADMDRVRKRIYDRLGSAEKGSARKLFARSATPDGVIDFSETFYPQVRTDGFSGLSGELLLDEAGRMFGDREAEIFYDFVDPDAARMVCVGDRAIALGGDGDRAEDLLRAPLPESVPFCKTHVCGLVDRAVTELSACRGIHDRIEEIYRPFVDYDRVNAESEALLARLKL